MSHISLPLNNIINERLKEAFPIDDGDLKANRAGYLSEKQRRDLLDARIWALLAVVSGTFLFAIVICVGMIGPEPGLKHPGYLLFSLCIGLFPLLVLLPYFRIMQDIKNNRVIALKGELKRHRYETKNGSDFQVQLEKKYFGVNEEVFKAFGNYQSFVLYVTPHADILVAAERIYTAPEKDKDF